MKTIATMSLLALMSSSVAYAGETTSADGKTLAVNFGEPTVKQVLHYRKMYDKKPFPDAEIYYYSNGLYKITPREKTITVSTSCRVSTPTRHTR